MNQAPPGLSQSYGGAPFGGSMFPTPIWYPPVGTKWIITLFIVFAGAVANRLKSDIRKMIVSPPGFLLISLLALYVLDRIERTPDGYSRKGCADISFWINLNRYSI